MSELPTTPNRPHNYDVLRDAEHAPEGQAEQGRDGRDDDGRGDMTSNAAPKIEPGDELYRVVKGQEHEQAQLDAVKARHEAQHGASNDFLAAMTAYAAVEGHERASDVPQAGFPEPSRAEVTQPRQQAQGENFAQAMDGYQGGGNFQALRAEQAKADPMASFVTDQDRAQHAAEEEAQRPTLGRTRGPSLEVA